jgi:hypothetical protein
MVVGECVEETSNRNCCISSSRKRLAISPALSGVSGSRGKHNFLSAGPLSPILPVIWTWRAKRACATGKILAGLVKHFNSFRMNDFLSLLDLSRTLRMARSWSRMRRETI